MPLFLVLWEKLLRTWVLVKVERSDVEIRDILANDARDVLLPHHTASSANICNPKSMVLFRILVRSMLLRDHLRHNRSKFGSQTIPLGLVPGQTRLGISVR